MKKAREGYKMTELGEIPEGWYISSISKVSEGVCVGFVGTCNKYYTTKDKGIPMIRTTNISHSGLKENDLKYVAEEFHKKNKKSQLKFGDVLVARHGESGKACLFDKSYEANCLNVVIIRPNKNIIDSKYLKETMNSKNIISQINEGVIGSVQNVVNTKTIADLNIAVPPIEEQQKIASILSSVDQQIEITDNLIEKTKELKKGLMQRLLTKGIGHEKFKDTEIGRIPEEWYISSISKVSEGVCVGFVGTCNKYYTTKDKGIPMIRTTNLSHSGLKENDLKYVAEEFHKKNKKSQLKFGDVLVARHGESGKACLFDKSYEANCLNVVIIRPNKNIIDSKYLKETMNSKNIISQINEGVIGSVQNVVNTKTIADLNIVVPPIEEQQKIASILSSADNQIEEYEFKKEKLEELKKGLLQKLLTGKIRVKI